MSKSKSVNIKARLNLKLDQGLKDWIMQYAERRGTTVSNLIRDHFVELYEADLSIKVREVVNQI